MAKGYNKLLRLTVLLVATLLLLSACGGEETVEKARESQEGREYTYPVVRLEGGDYGLPTPFLHYGRGPGGYKMALIFDSLLEYGEEGLIPWLAKDYQLSEDERSYRFTLREGDTWHDGKPVTAEDVKFSFEYFQEHPPVWNGVLLEGKPIVDSIEILEDDTLVFKLHEPTATSLEQIGRVRIIPKHIWEKVENPETYDEEEALIGSGPFQLTEYSSEHGTYEFTAFENYGGPKPGVEKIQFVPVSDSIMAFENRQVDMISINEDLLERYQENSEVEILEDPGFWGYRLVFNLEDQEVLQNKDVRRAIAYGIDADNLIDKVARGAATPGSPGYLPTDHIWYNERVGFYDYDSEKAKELLEGEEYSFTLLTGNDNREVRIGELLKLSLAEVGIDIEVESIDGKARDSALQEGNYEILLTGHGGWGSDGDSLRSRYRISGFHNEKIEDLGRAQLVEMDPEKRKEKIFALQEEIAKEVPMLPLFNTKGYRVYYRDGYDNWVYMFDHHNPIHSKLSFLEEIR
ncbi:ABC transporter substrate-binding protein [Isachenkonia alkalipeptolytica]|uniref:Diguanylate phosphodiesterase n=1 Tax=Isachenkonia alkalipeptolytica TaxID=2565777 RepID=A0AA44BEH5_9CLOT|nr:ABC transporter substrate-binding protein [Isachenkonia alkalipeptolytica]NBG88140.1 diguanylate phosphodiesterase [Isachenkonia alkalipeptolytica]